MYAIRSYYEIIQSAVDSTRSSSGEISVSIREITGNLDKLSEFMDSTVASIRITSYNVCYTKLLRISAGFQAVRLHRRR